MLEECSGKSVPSFLSGGHGPFGVCQGAGDDVGPDLPMAVVNGRVGNGRPSPS